MNEIIKQSISDFYIFFNKLHEIVKPPVLIHRSGFPQFRYEEKSVETLCLIKTGRLLSSLNAITLLFDSGYFVEIAVLIRTIKESYADLSFLLENYPNEKFSKSQLQYIDDFFQEQFSDPLNPVKSIHKHKRVPSKKIHAGFARTFSNLSKFIKNPELRAKIQKIANPSDHQEATLAILNTYSGYVHYGYTQSIEIIGGEPPEYHLEGMAGTPKVYEWQSTIITELDAIYNHFLFLCLRFKFNDEFEILRTKQKEFQILSGYNPEIE